MTHPVPFTDWKMAIEYSEKNSKFGCVLCEKTHFAKDCPNRVVKISAEKNYKSMYEKNEDDNVNYGW